MDETNCLGIQIFAETHACMDLYQKAKSFSLLHFEDLILGEELGSLSEIQLIDLISNDELEVEKEEVVFLAAIKWLEADQQDTKQIKIHLFFKRQIKFRKRGSTFFRVGLKKFF